MNETFYKILTHIGLVLQWFFGSLFVLSVFIYMTESLLATFMFFLLAMITLPPTYQLITKKLNFDLMQVRVVVIVFLFFASLWAIPKRDTSNKVETIQHEAILENTNSPNAQNESEAFVSEKTVEESTYLVVGITDGDTIRVMYDGESTPVRLIGVDAPELQHPTEPVQCYALESKEKLEELLLNKYVALEIDVSETDQYDRLLRYIFLEGQNINELMVREGYLLESAFDPDIKYQELLKAAENSARSAYIGFWNPETCDGNVFTGTYKDPKLQEPTDTSDPAPVATTNTGSPTSPSTPSAPPPSSIPDQNNSSSYSCNCSKTCTQMASCDEAYYQLNTCGCRARDGDDDGIPCESLCR